jgi:mannose-6-phosphate isomerase-like protein (cupin superfamily)
MTNTSTESMTQPIRFSGDVLLHLSDGLGLEVATASAEFWKRRDAPVLASGRLLSIWSYETSWDYQEVHPDGDELVLLLSGDIDFMLDSGDGERRLHLEPGEACVVPAGTWHRAEIHGPSTALFITPVPATTEHREVRPAG